MPVTDGKDFAVVRAAVIRLRRSPSAGGYEAFVVIPETASMKGLLDTLPNLKIWYSTDKARIPIKIQSRFPVGNFAFEYRGSLIRYWLHKGKAVIRDSAERKRIEAVPAISF